MLLNYFANNPPPWVGVLAFTPLLFRYSRAVVLYGFGGANFDPRYLSR